MGSRRRSSGDAAESRSAYSDLFRGARSRRGVRILVPASVKRRRRADRGSAAIGGGALLSDGCVTRFACARGRLANVRTSSSHVPPIAKTIPHQLPGL